MLSFALIERLAADLSSMATLLIVAAEAIRFHRKSRRIAARLRRIEQRIAHERRPTHERHDRLPAMAQQTLTHARTKVA